MKLNLVIPALFVSYAVSAVSGILCKGGLSMIGSGKNCSIVNRASDGLLCTDFEYDEKRRYIYTKVPSDSSDGCYWNIETIFIDPCHTFKLKSLSNREYLHASSDDMKYNELRRNVFAWIPKRGLGNESYWDIEPLGDDSGYVTIKNTEYDEYLYAINDSDYESKRQVFTGEYTYEDEPVAYDKDCHWAIKCD